MNTVPTPVKTGERGWHPTRLRGFIHKGMNDPIVNSRRPLEYDEVRIRANISHNWVTLKYSPMF
uniref:Uncharacterized protein n=1 Tax=Anguilla anguilla TaxID=7936 RepID=A0A0E9Q4S0_ANGAN